MSDLLALAADLARTQWPTGPTTVVTCPLYVHQPTDITCEHAFPRCTADEFEPGVLTITAVDSGEPIRVFNENEWLRASVKDAQGFTEFSFNNQKASSDASDRPVDSTSRAARHTAA